MFYLCCFLAQTDWPPMQICLFLAFFFTIDTLRPQLAFSAGITKTHGLPAFFMKGANVRSMCTRKDWPSVSPGLAKGIPSVRKFKEKGNIYNCLRRRPVHNVCDVYCLHAIGILFRSY